MLFLPASHVNYKLAAIPAADTTVTLILASNVWNHTKFLKAFELF